MTELSSFELPFLGAASGSSPEPEPSEHGDGGSGEEALEVVDVHLQETRDLAEMLEHHFRDDPLVHVGGDVAVYYEEGNPAAAIVPDVLVLRQEADRSPPRHFKLWERGASPAAVIEVTSAATREDDLGRKREVCRRLGVEEYFLYDPLGEHLEPRFRGYRLAGRSYEPLAPEADGSVVSDLGLSFAFSGRLIVVDVASGKPLMHTAEALDELERLRGDVARMLG